MSTLPEALPLLAGLLRLRMLRSMGSGRSDRVDIQGEVVKPSMTDAETAAHLRRWADKSDNFHRGHPAFGWPTDACGYDQHIRFVDHRNKHWQGGDFPAFVRAYADSFGIHLHRREDVNKTEMRALVVKCKCVRKVNKILLEKNARLVTTLLTGKVACVVEKADDTKRGKLPYMLASYCPFCGKAYPS